MARYVAPGVAAKHVALSVALHRMLSVTLYRVLSVAKHRVLSVVPSRRAAFRAGSAAPPACPSRSAALADAAHPACHAATGTL